MRLEELIHRATRGLDLNPRRVFRPSLVYEVLHDPFWLWCHYHAPREEAVDEKSRYDELRRQRGIEFEQAWVRGNYPDAVRIEPAFGLEALSRTLQAMLEGAAVIYQPQLWDLASECAGRGDLLVRDGSFGSELGPYHYRIGEIKSARNLQDYHVLEAALYNRMVGAIQGYTPEEVTIALRGTLERASYSENTDRLDEILSTWRALRDGDLVPEPGRPPKVTGSPWAVYGNKLVRATKDLVLLAGISAKERQKLREAGLGSVDRVWAVRLEELSEILGEPYGEIAYYVAQAYRTGEPILKPGSRLAIPRAKRLLYFDFETSDDVHPREPPHVYLIGCWDSMRDQYVKFLARGAQDEGKILADFLDYVGDLENTLLYHWTEFEIGEIRKISRRWPFLEGALERLVSRCVDLKAAIQSAVYLPVPTYSIKSVAPALGFKWRQADVDAYEAMVCYWDYLDGSDNSVIRKAIIYNEDDCLAMWHVDQELTRRFGGA